MSEVDDEGQVLATFSDVSWPRHLATDSEGHVIVADCSNHRILLLNSELHLERVLVDTNFQVKPWGSARLHHHELTSQLYVLHRSDNVRQSPRIASHCLSILSAINNRLNCSHANEPSI